MVKYLHTFRLQHNITQHVQHKILAKYDQLSYMGAVRTIFLICKLYDHPRVVGVPVTCLM